MKSLLSKLFGLTKTVGKKINSASDKISETTKTLKSKKPTNEFYEYAKTAPMYKTKAQKEILDYGPNSTFGDVDSAYGAKQLGQHTLERLKGIDPYELSEMRRMIAVSPDTKIFNNKFNTDPTAGYKYKNYYDTFRKEFMDLKEKPNQKYLVTDFDKKPNHITPDEIYNKPEKNYLEEYNDSITKGRYNTMKEYALLDDGRSLPYKSLNHSDIPNIVGTFQKGSIGLFDPKHAIAGTVNPANKTMARRIMKRMDEIASYNRYKNMSPELQAYANAFSNRYKRRIPAHLMTIEQPHGVPQGNLLSEQIYDDTYNFLRRKLENAKEPSAEYDPKLLEQLIEGKLPIKAKTLDDNSAFYDAVGDSAGGLPHFGGFGFNAKVPPTSPSIHVPYADYRFVETHPLDINKLRTSSRYTERLKDLNGDTRLVAFNKLNDYPVSESNKIAMRNASSREATPYETAAHEGMHSLNSVNIDPKFINYDMRANKTYESPLYNPFSYVGGKTNEEYRAISMNKKIIERELMLRYPEVFEKIPELKKLPPRKQLEAAEELIAMAAMDPNVVLNRFNRYGILPNRKYKYGKATTSPRIPIDYVPFKPETIRSAYGINRSAQGPIQGVVGESSSEAYLRKLINQILGISAGVPAALYAIQDES